MQCERCQAREATEKVTHVAQDTAQIVHLCAECKERSLIDDEQGTVLRAAIRDAALKPKASSAPEDAALRSGLRRN